MTITYNGWSLTLDLNGGRIKELSRGSVKIFGTYQRIDGKQGNTHLCVPSFDKEGMEKYNLPFHGLVRSCPWNEEQRTKNKITISTITKSTELYPASLKVVQKFLLTETFRHIVTVTHVSGEPVPVNCGIHYYWDTPKGWNEIQINNINMKANIETNGFVKLAGKNTIQFPHASYELLSEGFNNAVLWTSFKENETGKDYSQDFCCIEPVISCPEYFGREESVIKPGEIKTVSISICAEDDSYFEPLSDNYLVDFTRLMELYQSKSEEDLHDKISLHDEKIIQFKILSD